MQFLLIRYVKIVLHDKSEQLLMNSRSVHKSISSTYIKLYPYSTFPMFSAVTFGHSRSAFIQIINWSTLSHFDDRILEQFDFYDMVFVKHVRQ